MKAKNTNIRHDNTVKKSNMEALKNAVYDTAKNQ